jgi:hypothetical protein
MAVARWFGGYGDHPIRAINLHGSAQWEPQSSGEYDLPKRL